MTMNARTLLIVTVLLGLTSGLRAEASRSAEEDFFEKNVRPVLVEHCAKCHGNGKSKGGLGLASRASVLKGGDSGPALVPGDAAKSLLLKAIRYDGDTQMPPKGKLPDRAIADLTTWIQRGAIWPAAPSGGDAIRAAARRSARRSANFWAFRPIADPPLPAIKDKAWPRQPLDRFVLAKREARGLHAVRPADKHALLRRVTFDLTGLPPTPGRDRGVSHAMIRPMPMPGWSIACWPRRTTANAGAGTGSTWPATARTRPTLSRPGSIPNGYRYRDWVVQAFNDDMPYDRFIIEQIAGDLLKDGKPDDRLAGAGLLRPGAASTTWTTPHGSSSRLRNWTIASTR